MFSPFSLQKKLVYEESNYTTNSCKEKKKKDVLYSCIGPAKFT